MFDVFIWIQLVDNILVVYLSHCLGLSISPSAMRYKNICRHLQFSESACKTFLKTQLVSYFQIYSFFPFL